MLIPLFVAGDDPMWDRQWVQWGLMAAFAVYFIFPVALTGWAFVSIVRARSARKVGAA
jgi:hypothetical protein